MLPVQVVTVIEVLKRNRCSGKQVKVLSVGVEQCMGGLKCVDKDRSSPDDTVSQTVESLEAWWVLEVPGIAVSNFLVELRTV